MVPISATSRERSETFISASLQPRRTLKQSASASGFHLNLLFLLHAAVLLFGYCWRFIILYCVYSERIFPCHLSISRKLAFHPEPDVDHVDGSQGTRHSRTVF